MVNISEIQDLLKDALQGVVQTNQSELLQLQQEIRELKTQVN